MLPILLSFTIALASTLSPTLGTKTRHVFLIMLDGLRWQEVFTGADESLINKDNGVTHIDETRAAYWRETPEARRAALMPFLWNTAIPLGRAYGNLLEGSDAHVTNPWRVSYPGYSETFCGYTNDAISDNRRVMNPDTTVFEWLNTKPEFKGKVAGFGTWDLYPYIFNIERSGISVDNGMGPLMFGKSSDTIALWNTARIETPYRWSGSCFDSMLFRPAMEWIKLNTPRVVFLGLGETDEWAHEGNYEQYLKAARRADGYIRELWEFVQSSAEYKDSTSFIVLCDHGRGGDNPHHLPQLEGGEQRAWRDHNAKVIGAQQIWVVVWGPDTPAKDKAAIGSASRSTEVVTQSQIATTLAALLGEDYRAAEPKAGEAIRGVVRARR